jgi:NAD(P)-dependent dehydrogenase (short-subunit alcohol dehydrogenase family)
MVRNVGSVQGKVALITGGARGVGAETAAQLVARGAKVVLVDLDPEPLSELVDRLGEANATSVTADVLQLSELEAAVAHGVDRFGGIDIVIASAGISSYGSIGVVDPAMFRRVVDINITGVFHTARAALAQLELRRGYILIVSSEAAYAPAPGLAAYNASKAGVEHLANALRLEVAFKGVAVGSAHMSWIDTPMVQDAKRDLQAFRELLDSLPGPLGVTTSVEACGEAFVKGIENRALRVNVPGWVGVLRWLKPVLTSRLFAFLSKRDAKRTLPLMDEEVARLGRSASARVTEQSSALEHS